MVGSDKLVILHILVLSFPVLHHTTKESLFANNLILYWLGYLDTGTLSEWDLKYVHRNKI